MPKTTITEALAELKTIDKRVEKKQQFVLEYLLRQDMVRDPHAKDGGSVVVIDRELQAISDLRDRSVMIRRSINIANHETVVTVNGKSRTLADWIIWRREVAPKVEQFVNSMASRISQVRQDALKKGVALVPAGSENLNMQDVLINVDEQNLAKQREELAATLETLDGQLSLKNATTTIEV